MPHLAETEHASGWSTGRLYYEALECVTWGECLAWETRDDAISAAKAVGRAMRLYRDRSRVGITIYAGTS